MIYFLHMLVASVTFLLVLNTFLRGAQKENISIFLSLFLVALGRAPGGARNARKGSRAPGRLLFGNFFLDKQEKVTCRGSATHK
jgi:hypothetical protein